MRGGLRSRAGSCTVLEFRPRQMSCRGAEWQQLHAVHAGGNVVGGIWEGICVLQAWQGLQPQVALQ